MPRSPEEVREIAAAAETGANRPLRRTQELRSAPEEGGKKRRRGKNGCSIHLGSSAMSTKSNQSPRDRAERMKHGWCPIHGVPMQLETGSPPRLICCGRVGFDLFAQ
jgi:hypothetical protein